MDGTQYGPEYQKQVSRARIAAEATSIDDQQEVFLAYKAIFEGPHKLHPKILKLTRIKQLLGDGKDRDYPPSSPVRKLGLEVVVRMIRGFMDRELFTSDAKARLAFPSLYKPMPGQDTRHETTEDARPGDQNEEIHMSTEMELLKVSEADRPEQDAPDEAPQDTPEGAQQDANKPRRRKADDLSIVGELSAADKRERPSCGPPSLYPVQIPFRPQHSMLVQRPGLPPSLYPVQIPFRPQYSMLVHRPGFGHPSLYPVKIPFRLQHSILVQTQALLEKCCYDFTLMWLPDLLTPNNWDCAEAIELNKWTQIVIQRHEQAPVEAFTEPSFSVRHSLQLVNDLRHAAVHRNRLSAKDIIRLLNAAVHFAQTLSDVARAAQLKELSLGLSSQFESQELYKQSLEAKYSAKFKEIERKRKDLDEQEQQVIAAMRAEDEGNTRSVGSSLDAMVEAIFDKEFVSSYTRRPGPGDHQADPAELEAEDEEPDGGVLLQPSDGKGWTASNLPSAAGLDGPGASNILRRAPP